MEAERGEEHKAYIRLPPEQVHQSRSKASGYEAAKTFDKARKPRATEANETQG
jgi:hypothetical protein